MWHVTCDTLHVTCDILSKFQLPCSYCLLFMILWRSGGNGSLNELINDEAVFRTAPATPGLLYLVLEQQERSSVSCWKLLSREQEYHQRCQQFVCLEIISKSRCRLGKRAAICEDTIWQQLRRSFKGLISSGHQRALQAAQWCRVCQCWCMMHLISMEGIIENSAWECNNGII